MNKQKFIEYLRKPVDLNEQNLEELERLIEEYPYFQSARTLLAKGSKINRSKNASQNINSAAIYATDRVLLKKYINDELIFLSPLPVHESHEADHERDLGKVLKTNRQTTSKQKIRKTQPKTSAPAVRPKENTPETEPVSAGETPGKPSNLDHIIEELYRDMEELKINRAKFREIESRLEEDEAVDKAVKKATGKAGEKKEKKADPAVNKKDETVKKPGESGAARKSSPKLEAEPKKNESKKAAERDVTGKHMEAVKKITEKEVPADKSDVESTDKEDPDAAGKGKKRSDQESIISNFIKKNPSISPGDSKKKIEEDLSGDSTILHPDLASEYLAEIYLEQGKKETAKKIYENLIVKFPEKSVYFAEIIKKLN